MNGCIALPGFCRRLPFGKIERRFLAQQSQPDIDQLDIDVHAVAVLRLVQLVVGVLELLGSIPQQVQCIALPAIAQVDTVLRLHITVAGDFTQFLFGDIMQLLELHLDISRVALLEQQLDGDRTLAAGLCREHAQCRQHTGIDRHQRMLHLQRIGQRAYV